MRDSIAVEQFRPIIEFIARQYPEGWIQLAELYQKTREWHNYETTLKHCIQRSTNVSITRDAWENLISFYSMKERFFDELFAHVQHSQLPQASFTTISESANRFNELYSRENYSFSREAKQQIIRPLIDLMEARISEADATDCSRLVWLYLHSNETKKAEEILNRGLSLEPNNFPLQKDYLLN